MQKILAILCLLLGVYSANAQELWTSVDVEASLTKKLELDVIGEFRWQQFGTPLKTGFGEAVLSYRIVKPLSIGFSYRYSQRSRSNGFYTLHTFASTLSYRYRVGDFRFAYRNKFETDKDTYTTSIEDLRWHFTDRNRIRVTYHKKHALLAPSVFVESFNEISARERYSLSELRTGANVDMILYHGYTLGVGAFVKHSFGSKKEYTYVGTLALTKEL
ncbi:MAG: DUF2490 domain-containing protein [Bacteroidales bacterium]|jgi:hypothetical protein|nr:DUF2490 domain-containing protein [Bacteroidales bacterium]